MGRAGGGAPLSSLPRAVREGAPPCGGARGPVAGVAGLACRRVQGGSPGPVDRVVCTAAIPAAASAREQCAIRGAGSGAGPESGVSGSGVESAATGGGHGGDSRVSGVVGGDLRRPVAVCGHLLSGGELAAAGDDPGVFAGVGRSGPLAEERQTQAGVCVSVAGGCPRCAPRRGGAGGVAAGGERRADGGAGVALSGGVSRRDSGLSQGSRATLSVVLLSGDSDRGPAGRLSRGHRHGGVCGPAGPGSVTRGGGVPEPEPEALYGAGDLDVPLHLDVAAARDVGPRAAGLDRATLGRRDARGDGRQGRPRRVQGASGRPAPNAGGCGGARQRPGARTGSGRRYHQRDHGGAGTGRDPRLAQPDRDARCHARAAGDRTVPDRPLSGAPIW